MTISRQGIIDAGPGLPIFSRVVAHCDTVYLCGVTPKAVDDMALFAEHNAEWNAWADRANPPVRACVGAPLFRPELLVEIMATAAR